MPLGDLVDDLGRDDAAGTGRLGEGELRSGGVTRDSINVVIPNYDNTVNPGIEPLYEAFFNDENARTCKKCGAVHPGKKPPPGWANI